MNFIEILKTKILQKFVNGLSIILIMIQFVFFVGFMIPFVLIYNPSLSLVYEFEIFAFLSVIFRLALAIWLVTTAMGGVDRAPLPAYSRVLRIALGITVLLTYVEAQIGGIIAALILLYVDSKRKKIIPNDTSP